jgi:pentatricopeptide repeat domain-containing protein 1
VANLRGGAITAIISACAQARNWKKALQLLEEMQAKGVEPNVFTYNATTSACEKGGQWEKALQLLEEMQAKGLEPNAITCSATTSACEKGGQWEKAGAAVAGGDAGEGSQAR